jgi:large subunit ribosomal protein L3
MTLESNYIENHHKAKSVSENSRSGLIAEKIGMTSIYLDDGSMVPVTVLKVIPSVIMARKTSANDGYDAVVVGYGDIKPKKLTKPMEGYFKKLEANPAAHVREFRVGVNYQYDDSNVNAGHFHEGQFVDVSGISIGKGFAGVMKRWNFRGLEASHGVSISHRSHGSTGQRQDPGKVFKGKKMAGHMGHKKVKIQNLKILSVDLDDEVIIIKGSVPGPKGSKVVITDAKKKDREL